MRLLQICFFFALCFSLWCLVFFDFYVKCISQGQKSWMFHWKTRSSFQSFADSFILNDELGISTTHKLTFYLLQITTYVDFEKVVFISLTDNMASYFIWRKKRVIFSCSTSDVSVWYLFQIAIYGRSFCAATKDAFMLIMRNVLRSVTNLFFAHIKDLCSSLSVCPLSVSPSVCLYSCRWVSRMHR